MLSWPSFMIPPLLFHTFKNPFPHILSRLLLEWVGKIIKFFSSMVYLSSRSLLILMLAIYLKVVYLKATLNGAQGILALSHLVSPSEKIKTGLSYNERLIFSAKSWKVNISGGEGAGTSSDEGGRDYNLRWNKPQRPRSSIFSPLVESSHTYLYQVTESHFFTN